MISVDNVYKTVQRILNKEQRGYFPPNEFNYFADLANTEVFENYFYEISQYNNAPIAMTEDDDYADIKKLLAEKIHVFEEETSISTGHTDFSSIDGFYRMGNVYNSTYETEEVTRREYRDILRSPLTSAFPLGMWFRDKNGITTNSSGVTMSYIRKPVSPYWAYMTVAGNPVLDPATSVDFELHESDLPDLVVKIAGYAGVAIKAADVAQAATAKEQMLDNQEKQ